MDREEARKYVNDTIEDASGALALGPWSIDVVYGACSGGQKVWGECFSEPKYMRGTITINTDEHETLEQVGKTVRHELLHLVHAEFNSYRAACTQALTKQEDDITDTVFDLAAERVVNTLETMLDLHDMSYDALVERSRGWQGKAGPAEDA